MKHWKSILWMLSAVVLVCGCGGGATPSSPAGTPLGGNGGAGSGDLTGNWEFQTTSMVGMPALTIAGNITQSGNSLAAQMHVSGSNCFDQQSTMVLTGTVSGDNASLSSVSVSGQVMMLNGTVNQHAITGSYSIKGGCADGDKGDFTAVNIPALANTLSGTFTNSQGGTFKMTANVAQNGTPNADGSYGIAGTATFSGLGLCFSSGTPSAGTSISGSYILGTSLSLVIEANNGTVAFVGNLNKDRSEIDGHYDVSGGSCDQSGTATLAPSSPWDY